MDGRNAADSFGRLPDDVELYPGTNRQIITSRPLDLSPALPAKDRWDALPRKYTVRGKTVEFFTIGALAKALNRKTVTLRLWEANGTIPVSLWRSPSEDYRGKQRLYSRAIIEAMVEIAREEGVLDPKSRNIHNSRFRERVYELFVRVAAAEAQATKAPQ
jgi:hypothetical protein